MYKSQQGIIQVMKERSFQKFKTHSNLTVEKVDYQVSSWFDFHEFANYKTELYCIWHKKINIQEQLYNIFRDWRS